MVAMPAVRLGSDLLLSSTRLRGTRVGVVCNHASVDLGFRHIIDRLEAAPGVHLAAIFGPQHGFRSDVQDNMVETPHGDDRARRVPVYSLYSDTREPTDDMLQRLAVAREALESNIRESTPTRSISTAAIRPTLATSLDR